MNADIERDQLNGIGVSVVTDETADSKALRSLCDWFARRGFVAASRADGEPTDTNTGGQVVVLVIGDDSVASDARPRHGDPWVWFRDDDRPLALDRWEGIGGPALIHCLRSTVTSGLGRHVEVHGYDDVPNPLTACRSDGIANETEMALLRTVDFLCRHAALPAVEAIADRHMSRLATIDTAGALAMLHDNGHIQCVPLAAGASGREELCDFYAQRFAAHVPPDLKRTIVSRTVAGDRIVDEVVLSFTHSRPIEWMLPGVPPTAKRIDVPIVSLTRVKDGKIVDQRVYWDQASVLVQAGLLCGAGLPVTGAAAAEELLRRTSTVPAGDARLERRGTQLVAKGYQTYLCDKQSGRLVPLDAALEAKCAAIDSELPSGDVIGRSVLDLGASTGFYSLWLLSRGAREATAIDLNDACLRVMRDIRAEMGVANLQVKRDDVLLCRERADIVLALGLIHWACARPTGTSLDAFIAGLAEAAQERLIVEWVDPADPSVAKLLDGKHANYRRDLFEQALTKHFAFHRPARLIAPTRQLYVATTAVPRGDQ